MNDKSRQVVVQNQRIALAVLRRMNISLSRDSEALSEALLGLCESAETWREDCGHSLSTHLWNGVRWHMCGWLTRKRCAPQLVGCDDYSGEQCSDPHQPDTLLELKTSALAIRAALSQRGIDPSLMTERLASGESLLAAVQSFDGYRGNGRVARRKMRRLRGALKERT